MQERLLGKLSLLMDQAEKIYFEAHAKQSPEFLEEPLWYTWTIAHFSMYITSLLLLSLYSSLSLSPHFSPEPKVAHLSWKNN
jgi:hypothetical protein